MLSLFRGLSFFILILCISFSAAAEQGSDDLNKEIQDSVAAEKAEMNKGLEEEKVLTPECKALAADPQADLNEVFSAGCEPTLAQMAKLMDNPVGNVAMLFTQFDWTRMKKDPENRTANNGLYTGIFQFPKSLTDEWNIINRVVWTVPSLPLDQDKIDDAGMRGPDLPPSGPGVVPSSLPIDAFNGRTTGFGDMYYVGLFSPKEGIKHDSGATSVWGAGWDMGFPTATEDILGSSQWSAGPSALYVYLGKKWKLGSLIQQYWDYAAEDSKADDVNLTNIQTLYFYSLDDTTSIGAAPNIIANWEKSSGNVWTVPIGVGVNKTINIGKIPVRLGLEAHYSVYRPDDDPGANWNFRFMIIPAAPSAMFDWMSDNLF